MGSIEQEQPVYSFDDYDLDDSVRDGINSLGFKSPTPIQALSIPIILSGSDIIACAQTGTGKTAAYLVPLMQHLVQLPPGKIRCLILVPTRELAIQIDQAMEGLSYYTGLTSVAVYGGREGDGWDRQKNAITSGVDIIIATPGRFKMHQNLGYMDLSGVEVLILDEADKMLDMGFYADIMDLIRLLPAERQSLMFSATMPPKIRKLARDILRDPQEVNIALSKPAEGVYQSAYAVTDAQKIPLVEALMKEREVDSMIIFASSKISVDQITRRLVKAGYDARAIHSDREQDERIATLTAFKNKQFPIVVATDVLSRGIDIDNLSHVLNYDVPLDAEDYVHRIGRTARASSTGEAITFITPEDAYKFWRIEALIGSEVPKLPLPPQIGRSPELSKSERPPLRGGKGGGGRHSSSGPRGGHGGGQHSQGRGPGGNRSAEGGRGRGDNRNRKPGDRPAS